jgi:Dynamin family
MENKKKRGQDPLSFCNGPPSKAARSGDNDDARAIVTSISGRQGKPKEEDCSPHPKTTAEEEILAEEDDITTNTDPHAEYDKDVAQSRETLTKLLELFRDPKNVTFCSEKRRNEWSWEIMDLKNEGPPEAVIGCLGASGAGKSSLLNALLNESEILPTSGSRGCTAAVVELRFNPFFVNNNPVGDDREEEEEEAAVYRGVIEFISLREWHDELQLLLDECSFVCNNKGSSAWQEVIYSRAPEAVEAAAAWSKINQVYGHGMMESFAGQPKASVWEQLRQDPRLVELLTGTDEKQANTIVVEEGMVDATKAKVLLDNLPTLTGRLKRDKNKWARQFRKKINDYVYRKGGGKEPQTWPLIRKVTLYGPWAVLSTGACLVDLPGVRDANAARAKVAESYLQNCQKIWIVAPIKRAVDDKTAKDLLGAQFKRRLLMDGQYGNVAFICTHSDECENTEIIRDHEDVAKNVEGRWEKIKDLQNQIDAVQKEQAELNQTEEDLEEELVEIKANIKELGKCMRECQGEDSSRDSDSEDEDPGKELKSLEELLEKENVLLKALSLKIKAVRDKVKDLDHEYRSRHRCLKALAATVRNEYSTQCLQEDFKAGLEELIRKPDNEEMDDSCDVTDDQAPPPLPHDFQLEVHCISSNDYMKLLHLKTRSDGPPSTFTDAEDTQIPSLRAAVHATTAQNKHDFASDLVKLTTNMLERVRLFAIHSRGEEDANVKRFQEIFDKEVKAMDVTLIVDEFVRAMESTVHVNLQPAMQAGAKKGGSAATGTVASWSDKENCRTSWERGLNRNGLHWQTYQATMKRNGEYVSQTAGAIDLNQELCEPAEKEYCRNWQHTMCASIKVFLENANLQVQEVCSKAINAVVKEYAKAGIDESRSIEMGKNAMESCVMCAKASLKKMNTRQEDTQRDLSRSLASRVRGSMMPGYHSASNVARGRGFEKRMHKSMEEHSKRLGPSMFEAAIGELLDDVQQLVGIHRSALMGLATDISQSLYKVFSITWTDQGVRLDSNAKREALECRLRLRTQIGGLLEDHRKTLAGVKMEPHSGDDDAVVSVETWQDGIGKRMQHAEARGDFLHLSDLDDDDLKPRARVPPPEQTTYTPIEIQPDRAVSMMHRKMNGSLAYGSI